MSKYIKLDDAIGVATRGTNNYFICKALKDLPTIEVSEEQLSKLQTSENSVENTTVSEDFTSISRANSKLEVSEDAISREWVKEAIKKYGETYGTGTTMYLEQIAPKFIDDAPSVMPKAKEGEWKSKKASIYPYGYDVECSVCGHRMGSSFGYKFCPNCGAKMKGASDD